VRLIILLATLSIATPFIISQVATSFGSAVSERFLERPTNSDDPRYTIPPETATGKALSGDTLTEWVQAQGRLANGYATRVIPLDILYLVFLGTFLGIASTTLAGMIRWPAVFPHGPAGIFWLLPALYIFCDFAEDSLIFTMLNWPSTIRSVAFAALTVLRSVKIAAVALGLVQALLLCGLSYVWPSVLRS
jgi:hypothetical protein